ncbi:MAG: hypothetical protein M8353_07255 [ANME-2 cluster archaeon]|nr:hypothetical protein [ANME-2 cluster archaeon]
MVEAIRIHLKSEKDTELIVGKILAWMKRENRTDNVEILDSFFNYNPKTSILRIFVE